MTGKEFNPSGAGGEEDGSGLSVLDVLTLPDDQQQLVNWMMRQGEVHFADVVAHLGKDEEVARKLLDVLLEKGFVREIAREDKPIYRIQLASKRRRDLPRKIWDALE